MGKHLAVYILWCLSITGVARFKTCDSATVSQYTNIPTVDNSCSQNLSVTEGMSVTFDTRLQFGEQGSCQCIEEIQVLRVRKDQSNARTFEYTCAETGSNCNNKSGFVVNRAGSEQPYDFSLVLSSVTMSDSGRYYVEVEVMEPGLTSVRRFWKIFQLSIGPGESKFYWFLVNNLFK